MTKHLEFCGAHTYHYENATIEFVVNNLNWCQVRVRKTSFMQVSVRLDLPVRDFYKDDGKTSFISNICAYLGIDPGRLKIVQ